MTADEPGFEEYTSVAWTAAMRYLGMGWSIIPLRFSDKMPAIEWKQYQERQPTEDEVTGWFENGVPNGNGGLTKVFGLAIITGKLSGLVVCDCDNQDAISYAITEAGLFSMLNVSTTRGQHLYFKHPGGSEKVQNKVGGQGRDWPDVHGLDLRGDGGYVVAPPSLKFKSIEDGGGFQHQYKFNCPDDEIENFALGLPVWPGIKAKPVQQQVGEWSFDNLSLSAVKSYGADVWAQMGDRVAVLKRKLRDGDGRNAWLVRYIGECIASGMEEQQARVASEQFQIEFFEPPLPTVESETVLQSVLGTDKRNHPEKYAAKEKYDGKNEVRKGRADAIRLIVPSNLGALRNMAQGKKYLIDPFVPPQSIIQVVGFNGHGKSYFLLNMLWAAARGHSYGSAHVDAKVRALYLDFEGSSSTISSRIEDCTSIHGEMDEGFAIWNANVADDPMCLNEADGIERLGKLISDTSPQLVVIDTVRQAWLGMDENSPHSWVKVNAIAMACRNSGMSVIIVHHRNKPTMQGHGREAGSTAQLKDLDVQIIVTKVVLDLDQAKREAAMPDSATSIADFSGSTCTAWTYLRRALPTGSILRIVFEISFGKLRQATENHVTTYVGMAQDNATGKWTTVSSLTPLQKAMALHGHGRSACEISDLIGVSQPTVNGWLSGIGSK
jgi:hypothetical protein